MKQILLIITFLILSCILKELHSQGDTLSLYFLSDTQKSPEYEKLFLSSNNNDEARDLIFTSIKQNSPNSVFHLGDMVEFGFVPWEWEEIENFVKDLRASNINFYATPGNHEYLMFPKWGMYEFSKRFPSINIHGFTKKFGSTAVVIFNSNFSQLTTQEKIEELDWFNLTLQNYESDSSITYIIAGCHHSPFTNSKLVAPSYNDTIMINFLVKFYNSPKCILFLSGHAHTYEHFFVNNKDFLVIGGGGGLSHPLYSGADAKFKDLINSPEGERLFHYVTVKIYKKHLWVELNMCSPDFKKIITTGQLDFQQ